MSDKKPSFTVTVYPFGQAQTTQCESEEKLFAFLHTWFSISYSGDIEIAFKDTF
jgi:hypothetical protein